MDALAFGLYLALHLYPYVDECPHLPPLSDRSRFPGEYTARAQIDLCSEHAERLDHARRHNPNDGRFDRWIAETLLWKRYWELVALAHDSDFSERFHRERLNDLLLLLGPDAYFGGWKPFVFDRDKMPKAREAAPEANPA